MINAYLKRVPLRVRYLNPFSDSSLIWILDKHYGHKSIKVLNVFLFAGNSVDCVRKMLKDFYKMFKAIIIPIAHHKTEVPTKYLNLLGMELNTDHMTAKLPASKLQRYSLEVEKLLNSKKCTLKDLCSITGMLQFSTSVITVGICFLRRFYNCTVC